MNSCYIIRCKNAPVTIPNGAHVTLKCNGLVHGRFVYVRLHGKNFLQLCEVEVYSSPSMFAFIAFDCATGKNAPCL